MCGGVVWQAGHENIGGDNIGGEGDKGGGCGIGYKRASGI